MYRRLSVFAGGFTLEAAEAVGAGLPGEAEDVLDLIGRLVEQSLVAVEQDPDGEARYGMLEPVRQYARDKLEESGEADAVGGAHAAFFLALAEAAEPELRGPHQVGWLDRLEREHGNLRTAVSWFLEHGGAQDAVRLGWWLWLFWWARGHHGEGYAWMEAALARGDELPARERARALSVAGTMLMRMGDLLRAVPLYEESLALFRRVEDEAGVARASVGAGLGALRGGDPARGARLLEEVRRLYRAAGDAWNQAQTLVFLGALPFAGGDHERAAEHFEHAVGMARRIGDPFGMFAPTYHLAQAKQALGDHPGAALCRGAGARRGDRQHHQHGLLLAGTGGVLGCAGRDREGRPTVRGDGGLPGRRWPALRRARDGPGFPRAIPVPSVRSAGRSSVGGGVVRRPQDGLRAGGGLRARRRRGGARRALGERGTPYAGTGRSC